MIMGLLVVYSCWVWPTLILLGEPEKKKQQQNKTKQKKQNKIRKATSHSLGNCLLLDLSNPLRI